MNHCKIILCITILITTNMYGGMHEMAIMMGAQLGASIADNFITSRYQKVAKGIQNDQTTMGIATSSFVQNVQAAQQHQITAMMTLFSSAQQQINTLMTQQANAAQQMQEYLQSISSLQLGPKDYLVLPAKYDQLFANATMYTPQPNVWKNIFQIGNWQYDETNNSFWQMQLVPFTSITTDSTQLASQNLIFTEWITHKPYEIACDITLYKATYPFYVGIVFNKARWISGDSFGIQKYRTLGIYGDETKRVSVHYAQPIAPVVSANNTAAQSPVYPLKQIYQAQGLQKIILNQESFQTLQQQPITIHIKIKPAPNSIEYKIWLNNAMEPQSFIMLPTTPTTKSSKKITGNGDNLYLYHGVGFLSPGAIAQFKLLAPKQLVFSASSVQSFTKEFNEYVKQHQAKIATSQIDAALTGGQ